MTSHHVHKYSLSRLYDGGDAESPRPYWFVDAKWVCGIALVLALSVTLGLYSLYAITERQSSVEILARTMQTLVSINGAQSGVTGNVDEMVKKASAYPDLDVQLPPFTISVKGKEIAGLSPQDATTYVFRRVFERYYDGGANALVPIINGADSQRTFLSELNALSFFTAARHDQLWLPAVLSAGACALIAILLVLFSFRFGRLGSLGCALVAAGLPWATTSWLLAPPYRLARLVYAPLADPADPVGATMTALFPVIRNGVGQTYLILCAAGAGLIVVALLGSLSTRVVRMMRRSRVPEDFAPEESVFDAPISAGPATVEPVAIDAIPIDPVQQEAEPQGA